MKFKIIVFKFVVSRLGFYYACQAFSFYCGLATEIWISFVYSWKEAVIQPLCMDASVFSSSPTEYWEVGQVQSQEVDRGQGAVIRKSSPFPFWCGLQASLSGLPPHSGPMIHSLLSPQHAPAAPVLSSPSTVTWALGSRNTITNHFTFKLGFKCQFPRNVSSSNTSSRRNSLVAFL